jgi:hypothetical protein
MMIQLFKTTTILFFFCCCAAFSSVAASSTTPANPWLTILQVPSTTVSCFTCPYGFYDGCNICGCTNHSGAFPKTLACTKRYCAKDAYGAPSCNNKPPPITAVNCLSCPYGYFDGCNMCGCTGTRSNCTTRYCTNKMKGKPQCKPAPSKPQPQPGN